MPGSSEPVTTLPEGTAGYGFEKFSPNIPENPFITIKSATINPRII